MIGYILRRIVMIVPVMLVAGTITFALVHLTPGDPAGVMLGDEATPQQVRELRKRLGLNEPLLVQYPRWLLGVVQGDLGDSIFLQRPVSQAISERFIPTLQLTFYGLLIAVAIGVPAGVLAAMHQNSLLDRVLLTVAVGGSAIPSFFLGILLILLFAVTLRWLPAGGYVPFSEGIVAHFRSLALPALALGFSGAGLPARLIRISMLDTLHADYITAAVARGIPHRQVAWSHALRNALLPAVTVLGFALGDLLGGAIVVETVFGLPGMGQLVINSISRRDFPVIQGVVMVTALFYVVSNLIVDVLYHVLDPRVRDEQR